MSHVYLDYKISWVRFCVVTLTGADRNVRTVTVDPEAALAAAQTLLDAGFPAAVMVFKKEDTPELETNPDEASALIVHTRISEVAKYVGVSDITTLMFKFRFAHQWGITT